MTRRPPALRRVRIVLVAALTACLLVLGAAPVGASAPASLIEVSDDGVHFSDSEPIALFDDLSLVVPGDTETQRLWARSTAAEPGRLRLDLVDVVVGDLALAAATTVSFAIDGVDVGGVSLAEAGGCVVIDDATVLRGGATAHIDAQLAIDPALTAGQRGEVSLGLRLTLLDASVPPHGPGPCTVLPPHTPPPTSTPPDDGLAVSGTTAAAPFVAVSAALIVLGAIVRGRRAQHD